MKKLKTKYLYLAKCKIESLSLSTVLLAIYLTLAKIKSERLKNLQERVYTFFSIDRVCAIYLRKKYV